MDTNNSLVTAGVGGCGEAEEGTGGWMVRMETCLRVVHTQYSVQTMWSRTVHLKPA